MPPADTFFSFLGTLPRLWIFLKTFYFRFCVSHVILTPTRPKGIVFRLVLLVIWHILDRQAKTQIYMDLMQFSTADALVSNFSISNSTLELWELRNSTSEAFFSLKMMQWTHPKAPPYLTHFTDFKRRMHRCTAQPRRANSIAGTTCFVFTLCHTVGTLNIYYDKMTVYSIHTTPHNDSEMYTVPEKNLQNKKKCCVRYHTLCCDLSTSTARDHQFVSNGIIVLRSTRYRLLTTNGRTAKFTLHRRNIDYNIRSANLIIFLHISDSAHCDTSFFPYSALSRTQRTRMSEGANNVSALIQTFLTVYAPIQDSPYLLLSCLPATSSEILGRILRNVILRSNLDLDTTSIQRLLTDPILQLNVLGTEVRDAIGAERASSTHFAFPLLQRSTSSPWFLTALTIEGSLDTQQAEFLAAQSAKSSKALRSKGYAAAPSASSEPAKANPSNVKGARSEGIPSLTPKARGAPTTMRERTPRYAGHLKSRSRFTELLQGDHAPTTPPVLMPIRCELYHQLAEGHTQIPVGWLLGYHKAKDTRADTLLRGLRGLQLAIHSTSTAELSWCTDHLGTPPDCPPSHIHRMLSRMLTLEWVHSLNPVNPAEKADNLRVALQGPKSLMRMVDLFMTMIMRRLAPDSVESHTGTLEGTTVQLMGLRFYFQRIAPQGKQALVQVMKPKAIAEMEEIYKPACRMKFTERIGGLRGDLGIEAFLLCLCGFDLNLADQISVMGCLDMRITADSSLTATLNGYFIEFTLPIYKLVAARIFNNPQFNKFSSLYQLSGTISERSRSGIASVIPLSTPLAWNHGNEDVSTTPVHGSMDTHSDPDSPLDNFCEIYSPDIRVNEDTLIVQARCLPLWREHDFNGWCLLAAACIIRGLSTTVYDYSPLQLYNGVSAILDQFGFLLVSAGEEQSMLRTRDLLNHIKKIMETALRREGAYLWPELPPGVIGMISLATFANLTQHRVGGFLGVAEKVDAFHLTNQTFEYRYYSLKPGAMLTVDQILNPCQHLVTGQQALPILCQVNQHFQILTPREASTARALKHMLTKCPSQVCRPATWTEMTDTFGMNPRNPSDTTTGATQTGTPAPDCTGLSGGDGATAAQGETPGPAQATPPYYGSAAWARDYLRHSKFSSSLHSVGQPTNSQGVIERTQTDGPPLHAPGNGTSPSSLYTDLGRAQQGPHDQHADNSAPRSRTRISKEQHDTLDSMRFRNKAAAQSPTSAPAQAQLSGTLIQPKPINSDCGSSQRRGQAAAQKYSEPAYAQTPTADDGSAFLHELIMENRASTSPALHTEHPMTDPSTTLTYKDGDTEDPGDGNPAPQGFLVRLHPPNDSNWPQEERDIMTLMGEAKFRPPKLPVDAPYPHPSFHYHAVPAAMVDLRQTFDSFADIVEEIERIPRSKLQCVRRDPNRQMVEVGDCSDSGVALKAFPMLSYFLIGARNHLITLKLIHPMARWRIVLLLPSRNGKLADVQLPHTDEGWEVFPSDEDREKCRRAFSRNDSIIIGLGNGQHAEADTILDFAKGISHQLHQTEVSKRLDIKVTDTVRFHLRPGQAALFSSAAVHMGPAEVQGGSYRVFIQSISPSWPSVYLPKRNHAPRAYVLAFDMYHDPPSEHWFLTNQGTINRIPHSLWTEPWVQFLPRADYDSAFHSPLSIEVHRNSFAHLISDPRVFKNPTWGAHPSSPIANNPSFPYTIHPGVSLDDVGEFADDFGALAVTESTDAERTAVSDLASESDAEVDSTQEATQESTQEGLPADHETAEDVLTELLSSPESIRNQDGLEADLTTTYGLGKKRRRARARKIRNEKKVRLNAVYFVTYTTEQKAIIQSQRDAPRLRLTDTKLGKVVAPAIGKSYSPGELIWFLPPGIPGNSSLVSVPDPRDPTDTLLLRTRHSKYEYGLMTAREQERQTFRPRHRDPAAYVWATGDPSRANCYFDLSAMPFRIVASKWILAEEPIIYHDNREPVNYLGISRYCDFSDADVDEIISSVTVPSRPPFIRADGLNPQWEDHVSSVCRQTTFATIAALLQTLQDFQGPIFNLKLTVDHAAITTFPSLDGLNLLRHAFSLCTKQALPSPVNANLDYNLPAGREHLIRSLLYFGRDCYFRQLDTPISDAPIEALLLRCCNLGKMLRTIPLTTPFENPFTHSEVILLLTASHAPPNEIYVGGPNVFTHRSSSKSPVSQYVDWKGMAKWYGTTLGERLVVLHDPEKGCYWLNMVYWQQLRMAAMRWFEEAIKGALNRSKSMQHKLFARFATAEQILKELQLSKGYPSNYAGDGPTMADRATEATTDFYDPKSGCKMLVHSLPACIEAVYQFAHARQYHISEHTIIEWMLADGPNAFLYTYLIPTGAKHSKYFLDNPGDGFCGMWVMLRSVYLKCTEDEPPFPLTRDGSGGAALNLLLHKLITSITSLGYMDERISCLHRKLVFIWVRLKDLGMPVDPGLWSAVASDAITLDFTVITNQHSPEYLELEELDVALQLLHIRYVLWVPANDWNARYNADYLVIGCYHPFGLFPTGTLVDSTGPNSLRCLIQTLLNQDNLHVAFNRQHFYMIDDSATILSGLMAVCVQIVQAIHAATATTFKEPLARSTHMYHQDMEFSAMYLKHMLLGGHPGIIPAMSSLLPTQRGLHRQPGTCFKLNSPMTRYSPRRMAPAAARSMCADVDTNSSSYAVSHPDDCLYIADGRPYIPDGFLGSLANDLLGHTKPTYHATVRFTVHPREGLQTWLTAPRTLPRSTMISELSFDYGQAYWMDRMANSNGVLLEAILKKYDPLKYIPTLTLPEPLALTMQQVFAQVHTIHFLDNPLHYTSHGDVHWNLLAQHNRANRSPAPSHVSANAGGVLHEAAASRRDDMEQLHYTTGAADPDFPLTLRVEQPPLEGAPIARVPSDELNSETHHAVSPTDGTTRPHEESLSSTHNATDPVRVLSLSHVQSSYAATSLNPLTMARSASPRSTLPALGLMHQLPRRFPAGHIGWLFDPISLHWGLLSNSPLSPSEREQLKKRLFGTILPPLGNLPPHTFTQQAAATSPLDDEVIHWYQQEARQPRLVVIPHFKPKHGKTTWILALRQNAQILAGETILIPSGIITKKQNGSHIHQCGEGYFDTKKCDHDYGLMETQQEVCPPNPVNYVRYANPKHPSKYANARWDCTLNDFPKLVAITDLIADGTHPVHIILTPERAFRPPPQLLFQPGNIGQHTRTRAKGATTQVRPMLEDIPPPSGLFSDRTHPRLQDPSVPYRFRRSDNYAGLGSLNINGKFNETQIYNEVLRLMTNERLLGFAFLDTRLPHASVRVHRQILNRTFGTGAIIIPYPGRAPIVSTGLTDRDKLVGGITLLFLPRPGVRILHCLIDPHRLGLWVKVTMKVGGNSLTWIPCYIPHHSSAHNLAPNSGALHAKLANCLQYVGPNTEGSVESPMDWIFRKLAALMAGVYGTSDDHAILQGDLNLSYDQQDSSPHSLINRFQDMGLNFYHRECLDEFHISPLTYLQAYKDISDIDHCLCTASKHNIVAGGIGHHPSWAILGLDHRPVWIGLRLSTPISHIAMALRRLPMVKLHSTETWKDRYKNNAQTWFDRCVGKDDNYSKNFTFDSLSSPAHAEAQLEFLVYSIAHHFSLTYAKNDGPRHISHNSRRSRPGAQLEDPETVEISLMLAFYHDVHRLIQEDVTNPMDVRLQEEDMHYLAQEYAEDIAALYTRSDSTLTDTSTGCQQDIVSGRTLTNFWMSASKHEATLALTSDYEAMRHKSHGKYRKYKRLCINEHILKREELAAQMKLKKVIKSFLGTSTDPWSFDVIETDARDADGVPILETRPDHIHNILSSQAAKMFADQPDSIPGKLNAALEHSYDNWAALLDHPERLKSLLATKAPSIPQAARNHIADSICNKPQRHKINQELTAQFDKEFSFAYFTKLIARRDNNSSPGLSGLTIGMLKFIPNTLLHTLFQLLSLLWRANRIPAHWKVKWLHCIPKKDETISNITMLRPLGMLEILRKIWTLMIVKPIKRAAIKHKAIDNAQMAFLPNVGTDSELAIINSTLMEAKKLNLGIDMLSWDIAKAFDSVHRMIQFLVWVRMGVPQKVAELLIELDNNGTFVLKSPYALDQMVGIQAMSSQERYEAHYKLGFRVGRGYTQGDVLSTLGWVFLFDVVFTAVKNTRPDLHLRIRGIGSSLYTSGVVGFADDFITITIPELTPHFATATSAAYAILGLTSAVHKFRAISSHESHCRTISVFDHNWNGVAVKFEDNSHCIKVLGVIINLNLDWTPQYLAAKETFSHAIRLLKCKRGAITTKIKVLKMAIIPKLLYPLTKIGLTELQLKTLTSICDELYTHRHLERNFPKFLLHTRFAPLQTPDLGKITLTNQFNTLMRVQNEPTGSPGNLAASGLILEAVRCSMGDDPSLTGCDLNTDPRTSLYSRIDAHNTHTITGLMQHLNRHDVAIHIKGFKGAPDPLITILSKMSIILNDDARGILAAAEISYINELIEPNDNTAPRRWIPAGWIPLVQKIFGYDDSNLVDCVSDYILQYAHLYPPEGPPPCRITQGQLIKLRPQKDGPSVYFDCAGINIHTRMAEGCLYDTPTNIDADVAFKPVALRLTAGGIRLGVTGNYCISTTELSQRYEGRAIAVDITKQVGGISEYRLLHIHTMRMDFHTYYLQARLTPAWTKSIPVRHQLPSIICSAGHCATIPTDPLTLFHASANPRNDASGVLILNYGPSEQRQITSPYGIRCDFSEIPNITTTGADSLIGAALLHYYPNADITKISAGPGASLRLNKRQYRRGHINLSLGMLMRRGSKDRSKNKIKWIPTRRDPTDNPTPHQERQLASTARLLARNPRATLLGGLPQELLPIPCLDLFSGLFHTGEFYCSLKGTPILGNPLNEIPMDLDILRKYLVKRVVTYKSKHQWTEDTFGLYPHISKLMLHDPFHQRKAYCRQMFDHIYCNTVKVTRMMVQDQQSTCLCCTSNLDEDPNHILYCSSHPRTIYRKYVLDQMSSVSQSITDEYTQQLTKYILQLLFFEDIGNKRNLWMGRPSPQQLQRISSNLDLRIRWPDPKRFLLSMAQWYYTLIKHGLVLWHIRNIEMHMPSLDSEASDMTSSYTASASSQPAPVLNEISIDNLLILLGTYKSRRRYNAAKQKGSAMQLPLPFARIQRTSSISMDHEIPHEQRETPLSQISDITLDFSEDLLLVPSPRTGQDSSAEGPITPVVHAENPPQTNDNYRQIVEHSCLEYNCYTAQRVLLGEPINIDFPNEPTISHEHLTSLREGHSLHSVIMSSMLTLLQWHFNPLGQNEHILFVYYVFLQQLLTGTRSVRSLTRQFLALSHNKDISTIRSCLLLVHLPNISGGHWTFISIKFGDTVLVTYHDSIQALSCNFTQFIQPITDFLRALNITGNIECTVAQNPQQTDGHSCGVYALAGMIALAHGNVSWTLSAAQAACMRLDLCQSIIEVKLITHHSLYDTTPNHQPPGEPYPSPLPNKRQCSSQRLITDSFKRHKVHNTSDGHNYRKRTSPPHEDPPPKKSRTSPSYSQRVPTPQPHEEDGTPRKKTKKERLKNAIFTKLCD